MDLSNIEPGEMDRDELINTLGRLERARYKISDLQSGIMFELEERES